MTVDFWTNETSVLFTSYWGWTPETWGTVGWSDDLGFSRRANLLSQLTDPFITVCYVTGDKKHYRDPTLHRRIAGFYLVSHETGDRDQFTHPIHHATEPDKWRHSLRAVRAFSYLPEYRIHVSNLEQTLMRGARSIASMGAIITDPALISLFRDETPWVEVDVYNRTTDARTAQAESHQGWVRAGPASRDGYMVSSNISSLPRYLYVLKLAGDTSGFLGKNAGQRAIYKIGLSKSPQMRCQEFQNAMPRGAFDWRIVRPQHGSLSHPGYPFDAAVCGEDAMKQCLARNIGLDCVEWLGGEFYLATEAQIDEAWRRGCEVASAHQERS